jgi:hypothetical protein
VCVLVEAWQEGIFWGLGSLALPVVKLLFVVLHWKRTKRGFLIQIFSLILML